MVPRLAVQDRPPRGSPMKSALFAVCQLTTTADRARNRRVAESLVRQAADRGAEAICLPEMWPFIGPDEDKVRGAETLEGPSMELMRGLAQELGVWLFPGSFAEQAEDPGLVYNTATAIDPSGDVVAAYRKLHLFDMAVPNGATFTESDSVAAGDRAVLVDTPFGRVGLTICYDLRFPMLYQSLRDAGADVILVPSAFTAMTGKEHWELLIRARAVENQVYVVAAEQWGQHNSGRRSHGHSIIVDPWGHVVGQASEGEGIGLGLLDPGFTARVRQQLPCHGHKRAFEAPRPCSDKTTPDA
jgi:deaminated glutathione amidase